MAIRIRRLEESLEQVSTKLAHTHQPRESRLEMEHGGFSPPSAGTSRSTPPGQLEISSEQGQYVDVLGKGILTREYADALVEEFRIMSKMFPYVIIPEGNVVIKFRRNSPMLLLSILMVASWRDRTLQISLEQEYLQRLGVLMVAEGEQTLELLQSLLIHLTWCVLFAPSETRC